MNLVKGQRFKLQQIGVNSKLKLEVEKVFNNKLEIDICCFGVDENNNLSDDRYFIFYNQLSSPEGAIKKDSNKDIFYIDFSLIPKNIKKIILSMSIDGDGKINDINEGVLKFLKENLVLAEFKFKGSSYTKEKSIILLEIYIKDNFWRSNIVASGFNGGLGDVLRSYGGEEIEEEELPKEEEKKSNIFLEKKKKVEKLVLEKAPQLIDLTKKATITLEKKNLQNVVARVVVV